ncbi:hypothetical protein [Rhizobium sp. CECT 9324]|uniref:hypothetical protein n=1 Tax=Rhizobium sp. CECT 9324 TaxID=2845820 RepID=UPI001E2C5BDC|nr:hypothetical protein [Rhizobium sp. CECT 9324]
MIGIDARIDEADTDAHRTSITGRCPRLWPADKVADQRAATFTAGACIGLFRPIIVIEIDHGSRRVFGHHSTRIIHADPARNPEADHLIADKPDWPALNELEAIGPKQTQSRVVKAARNKLIGHAVRNDDRPRCSRLRLATLLEKGKSKTGTTDTLPAGFTPPTTTATGTASAIVVVATIVAIIIPPIVATVIVISVRGRYKRKSRCHRN